MPRVTVMPNGVTASCPRFGPPTDTRPRGRVRGWSKQATGRLRRWFYSVDGEQLDGRAYALTLTVRELPPSSGDWTATRKAFVERMRRAGMRRLQWLTEWQRRGVPHLHGIVYFDADDAPKAESVCDHWLEVADRWRARAEGQHVGEVWGLTGWLQYQAKHSARGVRHYQRANVPEGWQEGTGRLWGTSGQWPIREQLAEVDMRTFWRFRRLMRSWQLAEARQAEDYRRVSWVRRSLADPEPRRCACRAIGQFIPDTLSGDLLMAAAHGDVELLQAALEPLRNPLPPGSR